MEAGHIYPYPIPRHSLLDFAGHPPRVGRNQHETILFFIHHMFWTLSDFPPNVAIWLAQKSWNLKAL